MVVASKLEHNKRLGMDDFWTSNPDEEPDWFVQEKDDTDGADNAGEEDSGEDAAMSSTHHALVLLNAAASETSLRASLRTMTAVVRQRIRQTTTGGGGVRNGFGLVLYNTQYRWSADTSNDNKPKKISTINRSLDASLMDEEEEDNEEEDEEALFLQGTLPHWTNVQTLIPLEPPGVAMVQTLQQLTAPEEDPLDSYRPNGTLPADMGDTAPLPPLLLALRAARDMFANAKCVKKTKRTASTMKRADLPDVQELWILTDDNATTDSLINKDDDEMQRLLQEAVADLRDQGVSLHLWTVSSTNTSSSYPSLDSSLVTSVVRSAEEWMQYMSVVYKQTRPVYRVPLLWPDAQTSTNMILDVYRLYAAQREPKVLPIHQTTGKVLGKVQQLLTLDDGGGHVVAERRSFDKATRPPSTRRQLRTFLEFGSDLVPFSLQDKINVKKQCNIHPEGASLTLLGFKPAAAIPLHHCIDHSYFAVPSALMDDRQHGGNALAHLHAAMLRQDVVAVGELLTRVTATSRLVALRPVPEELRPAADDAWILLQAPGFLLTTLPFEEELRVADTADAMSPPSEDLILAMMQLVEKQSFVDAVEVGVDFVNAPMDRFWKYMEEIAYGGGEEKPAAQELYDTEIDAEQVLQHVGAQIQAVAALLPESTSVVTTAASTSARKRKPAPPPDESGIDWVQKVQDGTLSECKVPDLKAKLRSLGELTTGNKSALIERLEKYFAASDIARAPVDSPAERKVKIKQEEL